MVVFRFYDDAAGVESDAGARGCGDFWAGEYDREARRAGDTDVWVVVGDGEDKIRRLTLEHSIRSTATVPAAELTALEATLRNADSIRAYVDGVLYWVIPIKGFIGMEVKPGRAVGWWNVVSEFLVGRHFKASYWANDNGDRIVNSNGDPIVLMRRV